MKLNLDPTAGALWDKTSPSYPTYERLWNRLVPPSGMAPTTRGEGLRWVSKLVHDVYNNGGCNLSMEHFRDGLVVLTNYVDEKAEGLPEETLAKVRDAKTKVDETIAELLWIVDANEAAWNASVDGEIAEIEEPDLLDDTEFLRALEQLAEFVIWAVALDDGEAVALAEAPGSESVERRALRKILSIKGSTGGDAALVAEYRAIAELALAGEVRS